MKKLLLSLSAMAIAFASTAQCDKIFISEYVVGTGNNKAYELYNPTANDIVLNGYTLQRYSNGEQTAGDETALNGTIPAYGTWVVANGQTEDIDLGTFISPKCDPELQALANQLDNPYPAPTFMNGNDALVLVSNTGGILDIFGKPGEDPGQAWTAPDGTFITSGHTLIRKQNVIQGVTTIPVTFNPLAQWDTLAADTWTNLGMHACDCDPFLSAETQTPLEVSVYPTLLGNDVPITIRTNYAIREVEVYDITGKMIRTNLSLSGVNSGILNMGQVANGAYIMNIIMENNTTFSTRIIKN